jgi:hypothetical protein
MSQKILRIIFMVLVESFKIKFFSKLISLSEAIKNNNLSDEFNQHKEPLFDKPSFIIFLSNVISVECCVRLVIRGFEGGKKKSNIYAPLDEKLNL